MTIQKHVDNMWMPGGEFIRDLNDDLPARAAGGTAPLQNDHGGPLHYHDGEDQQQSFDFTCRTPRFLIDKAG